MLLKISLTFAIFNVLIFTKCYAEFANQIINYDDINFQLGLNKLAEPIHIVDGNIDSQPDELPVWSDAYQAMFNFKYGMSYEDWISLFSDEYRENYVMDRDIFNSSKAMPDTPLSNPPERTVLYEVYCNLAGREFLIVKIFNDLLDSVPNDFRNLSEGVATLVFEKQNGVWKNQLPAQFELLNKLPLNNFSALSEIVNSRSVIDDAQGLFLVPIESNQ